MKVGVIGAGLSGLYAAKLLEEAGIEVEIYEARDRVGGRAFTQKENGSQFDRGGEWIDADHERCISLVKELGLELDSSHALRWYWYGGEVCTEDSVWQDCLDSEQKFGELAKSLIESDSNQFSTLDELIRAAATSERGYWWLTAQYRSDEGEEPKHVGIEGWLAAYSNYLERTGGELSAYRVVGGFGGLTATLANRLKAKLNFGFEIRKVSEQSGSVTAFFSNGEEVQFDHLILTAPPSALSRMDLGDTVPKASLEAFQACKMARIVKLNMRFADAWWERMGWSGSGLLSHSPLQQVWPGGGTVMTAYSCGEDSEFWRSAPDIHAAVAAEVKRVFPEASELLEVVFTDWVSDPYAGGGFSYCTVGFTEEQRLQLAKGTARIHFAGEHTAQWMGFFEGALESAERAVREIL